MPTEEAEPAPRYASREEFFAKEVAPRLAEGWSYSRIAKELRIEKSSVYRMKKAADEKANGRSEGTSTRRPSPSAPEARRMAGEPDAVKIALMERDLADRKARDDQVARDLTSMRERLDKLGREGLKSENHDGALHVSCPNCGTSKDFEPPAPSFAKFDEVLSAFAQPHEGGKNALECASCRPKVEATLKELGYGLTKIGDE